MTKALLELLLHLIILVPFALLLLEKRTNENYLKIVLFSVVYSVYQILLILPGLSQSFVFFDSNWNWEGKMFGIAFGIICYLILNKQFSGNNFFSLRQNKENRRKTIIAAVSLTVFSIVLSYFMGSSDFDAETLLFELTMPSFDEEIMFRGILLGILLSALKPKVRFLGNPSVLITAVLFGFVHALGLNKDYSISFDPMFFLLTGLGGYVWGWVTWKSRSILLALISHNFCNFFGTLVTML